MGGRRSQPRGSRNLIRLDRGTAHVRSCWRYRQREACSRKPGLCCVGRTQYRRDVTQLPPGTPPPPPPGWYADGVGQQRWWDGRGWTSYTQPPAAPPPTPGQVRAPLPAGIPALAAAPKPKGRGFAVAALVLALLAFLTCFSPAAIGATSVLALLAIVFGAVGVGPRFGARGGAGAALGIATVAFIVGLSVFGVHQSGTASADTSASSGGNAGSQSTDSASATTSDAGAAADGSGTVAQASVPDGYTDQGNGIATKWDNANCSDSIISCTMLDIYATQSCSFVYIEANLLDSSGSIVGMTNGTASDMSAGDTAKIKLEYSEADAANVRLTKVQCE